MKKHTGPIGAIYSDWNQEKRGDDLQDNIPEVPVPGILRSEWEAMKKEGHSLTWECYYKWKNEKPDCEND